MINDRLTDIKLADEVIEIANRMGCDVHGYDCQEDAYYKMFLFLFKRLELLSKIADEKTPN